MFQISKACMCLCLLLLATCSEGKTTATATCQTPGLQEPASVTCHFSENVAEAVDVNAVLLRRFPIPNNGGNAVQKVVECHRYLEKEFDCLHKNGYGVIGTVSDQLIINITRAQPEHQSLFSCDLVRRHTTDQVAVCVFKYKDAVANDSTTSAPPPVQERDDQRKEASDKCREDDAGWNLRTIIITVSVVLGFILLLSVLLNIYLARERIQNWCCLWKSQTQNEENGNVSRTSGLQADAQEEHAPTDTSSSTDSVQSENTYQEIPDGQEQLSLGRLRSSRRCRAPREDPDGYLHASPSLPERLNTTDDTLLNASSARERPQSRQCPQPAQNSQSDSIPKTEDSQRKSRRPIHENCRGSPPETESML